MDNLHKDEKLLFAERLNHALDIFGIPPKGKGRQITVAKMFAVSQKRHKNQTTARKMHTSFLVRKYQQKISYSNPNLPNKRKRNHLKNNRNYLKHGFLFRKNRRRIQQLKWVFQYKGNTKSSKQSASR